MTCQLDPQFEHNFRAVWEDTPSSHAVPQSTLTALGLTRGDFLDVKAWIFLVARKLQFENGERAAFKACEALAALFGDASCFPMIQEALACVQKDDIPQVLASCCLKLTAQVGSEDFPVLQRQLKAGHQFESQNNEANHEDFLKMMNLEDSCAPTVLACLETAIFARLSSSEGFSFSRATALDILDLLHFAALKYLARYSHNIQEGLLLDRPTCGQLLAFLHCNSLIDCRLLALSVFIVSYRRQPKLLRTTLRELLIALLGSDVVNLAEPILAALKPRLLDDINDPRLSLRAYLVGIHRPTMDEIRAHLEVSS